MIIRQGIMGIETFVTISASHEGYRGSFPMNTPIMLHEQLARARGRAADEQLANYYIVRAMRLPWSIALNTSLLLDYLILGLFN